MKDTIIKLGDRQVPFRAPASLSVAQAIVATVQSSTAKPEHAHALIGAVMGGAWRGRLPGVETFWAYPNGLAFGAACFDALVAQGHTLDAMAPAFRAVFDLYTGRMLDGQVVEAIRGNSEAPAGLSSSSAAPVADGATLASIGAS